MHYRDLDVVDRVIVSAREGNFEIEPLWFHLAGLPSYLVLAELATNQVLVGSPPEVTYSPALQEQAPRRWWAQTEAEFDYARRYHATAGRVTQCVGLVARAASCAAHAVLAARGQWVTNEKQLLVRAELDAVDQIPATARPDPAVLQDVVTRARAACSAVLQDAIGKPAPRSGLR